VQEDNAAPHAHRHQAKVYDAYGVRRLLWPGNSPDLNAIEPCWAWLKKKTTARGAPTKRAEMEKEWRKAWRELSQEQIQKWIEAIPFHIEQVCLLYGGNEYKEGRPLFKRSWAGRRIKGILSTHSFLAVEDKEDEIDDGFEDVEDEDGVDTEEA
jgi:hypothetical protein